MRPRLPLWVRARLCYDDGANMVEYAMVLLLIVVVSILVVGQIGEAPPESFSLVNTGFD